MRDAPVILLDEPFSAVDAATEADLMGIVRRWHREGRIVVVVLHDLDLIRAAFPEVLLLGAGAAVWGPTQDVLTARTARDARLRARFPEPEALGPETIEPAALAPEAIDPAALAPVTMDPAARAAVTMEAAA